MGWKNNFLECNILVNNGLNGGRKNSIAQFSNCIRKFSLNLRVYKFGKNFLEIKTPSKFYFWSNRYFLNTFLIFFSTFIFGDGCVPEPINALTVSDRGCQCQDSIGYGDLDRTCACCYPSMNTCPCAYPYFGFKDTTTLIWNRRLESS